MAEEKLVLEDVVAELKRIAEQLFDLKKVLEKIESKLGR